MVRSVRRLCFPLGILAWGVACPSVISAQTPGTLTGRVLDEKNGSPVAYATIALRALDADGSGEVPGHGIRRTSTDRTGLYAFPELPRGRFTLVLERFGYRTYSLELTLDRDEPLFLTILAEPVPFPLDAISTVAPSARSPSLVRPRRDPATRGERGRASQERVRQERYLSRDVRQLGHADLRAANTLLDDDVLRAFQQAPGVAARDDYSADLWTRGAASGHTVVHFDGVPLLGGLHALGVFSGLNPDMLESATFEPGVPGASLQGAGAGVIHVRSRSPAIAPQSRSAAVSPISARIAVDGRPSDRIAWAVGARRSYVDALAVLPGNLAGGRNRLPYAFADLTGRLDLALSHRSRLEVSGFWQEDRVFGDVGELARGNRGEWGASVARATLVAALNGGVLRQTIASSGFGAAVRVTTTEDGSWPLHPPTDNRYRILLWEGRFDSHPAPDGSWSVGIRATREDHTYAGPGADPAGLLQPAELQRRGVPDLTSILLGVPRDSLAEKSGMTRIAAWGEGRHRLSRGLVAEAGLRVETGSRVDDGEVRLVPRLQLGYHRDGSPLSVSAGWGRTWQYRQSIARTDVLRPGLRASEVLVQAARGVPALRSDVFTLGAEAWLGRDAWLVGATGWVRTSDGILVPSPTPGAIDGPRARVSTTGDAHGLELSARKLEGRVRGFANHSLGWSRRRVGVDRFDASENRRRVTNMGIEVDVRADWRLGATYRAESGAPYTRVTLVDGPCTVATNCGSIPALLHGVPGGQRGPSTARLDLGTEWTFAFDGWSLTAYGQLRNALGATNAVTYHSSCACRGEGEVAVMQLRDVFDPGLPRLPVLGLRARF